MEDAKTEGEAGQVSVRRPARARVGQVLCGKWRLDRLIAVGGMAAVYAATHRFGRRAALKILHGSLAEDESVRERFLREGYAANQVGHPGAVAVLDLDVAEDGAPFLVMELLEGETLDQRWLRTGPMSPEDVLAMADQLLDVLAAAHDAGVVHRDLKPENVMVLADGSIKVLDFGIARMPASADATDTGLLMGTPAFMPPEQMRARWADVDARSDLWAAGALMFSLVAGRYVHQRESPADMIIACATEPAPSLATVASLPLELVDVVDRALAFEPEDRFQSARSMQRAVRAAMLAIMRRNADAWTDPLAYAPTDDGSGEVARMLAESGSYPPPPPKESGMYPVAAPPRREAPPVHGAVGQLKKVALAATATVALGAKVVLLCALAGQLASASLEQPVTLQRVELAAR